MREPLRSGTRLGRYEIDAMVGAGGMGEVYRARDTELGRAVAIRVLPAAFADHPDRLRRFEVEARAAAALNHPNILAVYDVGQHDGTPYLVSELLDGQTLRARLDGAALRYKISGNGGTHPIWRQDGRELFYKSADGKLVAVSVMTAPRFEYRQSPAAVTLPPDATFYDVAPDGQRFLVLVPAPDAQASSPFTVVLNWHEQLKQHMSTR